MYLNPRSILFLIFIYLLYKYFINFLLSIFFVIISLAIIVVIRLKNHNRERLGVIYLNLVNCMTLGINNRLGLNEIFNLYQSIFY